MNFAIHLPGFFRLTSFRLVVGIILAVLVQAAPGPVWGQAPTALEGHTNAVSSAIYHPSGKLVITGSMDRSLMIWDAATGKSLRTLTGHEGQVLAIAVRGDGREATSTSRDSKILVWDVYDPAPLRQLAGHSEAVNVIQLNAEGSWLVSGSVDQSLRVWQTADGMMLHELKAHQAAVNRVAIAADDALIASADAGGVICLWTAEDGTLVANLGAHQGGVAGLQFHPTNPVFMSAGSDGTVKMWNLPIVAPRSLPPAAAEVAAVLASADAKMMVVGSASSIALLDAEGAPVRALEGQSGAVTVLARNADTSLVASGSEEGVIQLWNSADGADRFSMRGHSGAIRRLVFHPEGKQIASAGADGTVRVWRLPSADMELTGHTMPVTAVAESADGKLIASGSEDKSVRLWNAADGVAVRALAGNTEIARSVAFRADGLQIASGDMVGAVRFWNVADGADQGSLVAHQGEVVGISFLPDGTQMLSAEVGGLLKWWKVPIVAPRVVGGNEDAVTAMTLTADGKLMISGSSDKSLRIFDATNGNPVRQLAGQSGAVTAVDVDAAGTLVAAGGDDGVVRFWKLADGSDAGSLSGHVGAVLGVAFHPQGKQIATCGADGTARIWNLPVPPKTISGSAMPVTVSAFSVDGALLATAGVAAGKPTIVVRETVTGKVVATLLGHEAAVTSLAFSADKNQTRIRFGRQIGSRMEFGRSQVRGIGAICRQPDAGYGGRLSHRRQFDILWHCRQETAAMEYCGGRNGSRVCRAYRRRYRSDAGRHHAGIGFGGYDRSLVECGQRRRGTQHQSCRRGDQYRRDTKPRGNCLGRCRQERKTVGTAPTARRSVF